MSDKTPCSDCGMCPYTSVDCANSGDCDQQRREYPMENRVRKMHAWPHDSSGLRIFLTREYVGWQVMGHTVTERFCRRW